MADPDDRQVFQEFLSAFDTPAFLRRARAMEDAWQAVIEQCRLERTRLLEMPRLRLARLFALVQPWSQLNRRLCNSEDGAYLAELHQEWQPRLRSRIGPANTEAEVVRALTALSSSFERFNRLWLKYVDDIDLEQINHLRDSYNRNYLIEKECAVQSVQVARRGFMPMPRVSTEDLINAFPFLKIPSAILKN